MAKKKFRFFFRAKKSQKIAKIDVFIRVLEVIFAKIDPSTHITGYRGEKVTIPSFSMLLRMNIPGEKGPELTKLFAHDAKT